MAVGEAAGRAVCATSPRRSNHGNLHVRGYKEEGTTTTHGRQSPNSSPLRPTACFSFSRRPPVPAASTGCARRDRIKDLRFTIYEPGAETPRARECLVIRNSYIVNSHAS